MSEEIYYRIEGGQMHMDQDRMLRIAKLQANRTNKPVQMLKVRRTDTITKLYLVRPDQEIQDAYDRGFKEGSK